jgi:ribA/ribD-fused uncharacterized protein
MEVITEIVSFDKDYEFLSNFYHSPFTVDGIQYDTVEHFFQSRKASTWDEAMWVNAADTPGLAKGRGRKVSMRPDWEQIKVDVMRFALEQKFAIPELKEKLLATGNIELIEGNWWDDNFWGDCYCPACQSFQGKNMLGKLLMELREKLKGQS